MKIVRRVALAMVMLSQTLPTLAYDNGYVITTHRSSVFENTDCEKTQSCTLKRVEYIVEDYRQMIDNDYAYGTRFSARYETEAVNHLEDYVFVQFVRGCVYWDDWGQLKNGKTPRNYVVYGSPKDPAKTKDFKFSEWIVDDNDDGNPDPAYTSISPALPRHALAHWNIVPGSVDEATQRFYGKNCPKFPELYIADWPHGVYVNKAGNAKNASLQFRTCVYKATDVPTSLSPEGPKIGEPLNCFDWNVSYLYNYAKGVYEHPDAIVCPICDK